MMAHNTLTQRVDEGLDLNLAWERLSALARYIECALQEAEVIQGAVGRDVAMDVLSEQIQSMLIRAQHLAGGLGKEIHDAGET